MTISKISKTLAICAALVAASPAFATTQLSLTSPVLGPGASMHPSGGPVGFDVGAVVTFTVNETIENALITPDFFCIDCVVRFDLHSEAPDLTSTTKSYISSLLLTTSDFALNSSMDPQIDAGTLMAGTTYSLVARARADISLWLGSTAADLITTGTGAVTRGSSYLIPAFDTAFTQPLAQTLFEPADANLLFSIEGDLALAPTQVPLPASALLLGLALPALRLAGRRSL